MSEDTGINAVGGRGPDVCVSRGERELYSGSQEGLVAALSRPRSAGADALLGVRQPVLDHGFVELLDYMGTDAEIVLSARTTSGTTAELLPDDGKPRTWDDDVKLLRYMMRHRHTSPFEMCELRLLVQAPIFVERQWVRHRTANWNGHSLRYGPPLGVFYKPAREHVAAQSSSNRQGRGEALTGVELEMALDLMSDRAWECGESYERLAVSLGVARELARTVLPMSLYTRWVWKIDAHNLMHFLSLRLDPHAQLEIRAYAEPIADIVKAWLPETWRAFEDYRLGALTLTRIEVAALAAVLARRDLQDDSLVALAQRAGAEAGLVGRELAEFVVKVGRIAAAPALDRLAGGER